MSAAFPRPATAAEAPVSRIETTPVARDRSSMAPLLLGSLLGALVAGRIETGLLGLVIALAGCAFVGARWPGRGWVVAFGSGALVAWLLNIYLTPGAPLAGWPVVLGRSATAEGLALGALLLLRAAGALASVQGLRAAWPGERAADELAARLAPLERLRVPVRELRAMLGLALRFAPLLRTEAARIGRVQALRAGRPPRGPREWLRRRRAAAVPTLVGALERAERVALALEARHYRVRPVARPDRRTRLGPAALAGIAVALVALLWRR
jgi:energy-coupling factor transporter transmembrane protein EcfT